MNKENVTNLLSTMTALASTFIETVSDFLPLEIAMTQEEMDRVLAESQADLSRHRLRDAVQHCHHFVGISAVRATFQTIL